MMKNKQLVRSNQDKMVAGVATGLAEYFDMDPAMVRLIFVLMALLGGHGILVYMILMFIMPQES